MKLLASLAGKMLASMRRKKPAAAAVPDVPKPSWAFEHHEYLGIHEGSHVYAAVYTRGDNEWTVAAHRFHAERGIKSDDRLVPYFRANPPPRG